MADIGIRTDSDTLVLWRGRDFKWTFENLDVDGNPVDFPPGRLYFELQTGGEHNSEQTVTITRATGGTYTLNVMGNDTPPIDYNDVTDNPQGLPGDFTEAVEAAAGVGNVAVAPLQLQPFWILNFNLNSSYPLDEQLVNLINKTANDFFNLFDELFGVNIEMTVQDNLNFTLSVNSIRTFDEIALVTFAVDVTSAAVRDFFNGVTGLIGAVDTVNVDFYWNRIFRIEFVGELANQPIPIIGADASGLLGTNPEVVTEVISPGKRPLTEWDFVIENHLATLKVESEEADEIAERTKWQLVFLPEGEPAGGDPVTRGIVQRLG